MKVDVNHKLIVTIVRKGCAEKIVSATREAGARGGTIIPGRGVGIHEKKKILGIPIEPEKDIVLTLVPENLVDSVLQAVVGAGKLQSPGTGIGFVIDVEKVVGVVSLIENLCPRQE